MTASVRPRLLESLSRRSLAYADPLDRAVDVASLGQQQLRRVELGCQAAECVSEHVVDLARDARSLIERRCSPALRLGALRLGDERLRGTAPFHILAAGEPDECACEDDRRIAERRADAEARPQDTRLQRHNRQRGGREGLERQPVGDDLDHSDGWQGQRRAAVLQRREQAAGAHHQRARAVRYAGIYGTRHWFSASLDSWMLAHRITADALTNALVLEALAMTSARTLSLLVRGRPRASSPLANAMGAGSAI